MAEGHDKASDFGHSEPRPASAAIEARGRGRKHDKPAAHGSKTENSKPEGMLPTLDPIKALPEGSYVTRNLKCVRCGSLLPNAPWPVDNPSIEHRPGCPYCGSRMTFPVAADKETGPWPFKVPGT